jgi:hypothetical protein
MLKSVQVGGLHLLKNLTAAEVLFKHNTFIGKIPSQKIPLNNEQTSKQ